MARDGVSLARETAQKQGPHPAVVVRESDREAGRRAVTADNADNKLEDIQSFPILTKEISFPAPPSPGAPSAAGAAPLGQIVENALREVLGWRPKTSDPKGFLAALTQAFTCTEVAGYTKCTWTPRSYAVQADIGALTGAQASIYKRAKAAIDQSLPLLDGLYPLRADADIEDLDAARAIVRSELLELVRELGLEGGPRVQRVDELLALLLGPESASTVPEQVQGQLGELRERFGLKRENVNTVEEEQNLTNFLILADNITCLGTQAVLLARALGSVAESVKEVYFVLDSVFLGPAERQTTQLDIPGETPIFVSELLEWVEYFASEEGPRLIKEGGKDGVIRAFVPTLDRIRRLVNGALAISQQDSSNPGRDFHTARVQAALEGLKNELDETFRLANQIKRLPRPEITSVDPDHAARGARVRLTVDGGHFQSGAQVRLNKSGPSKDEIRANPVTIVGTTQISAFFDLTVSQAQPGSTWTVVVVNPDGGFDRLQDAFTITEDGVAVPSPPPGPTVDGVQPPSAFQGTTLSVTISGAGFQPGATSEFAEAGVTVRETGFVNAGRLVAVIDIASAAGSGPTSVTVRNPDGKSGTKVGAFTVQQVP